MHIIMRSSVSGSSHITHSSSIYLAVVIPNCLVTCVDATYRGLYDHKAAGPRFRGSGTQLLARNVVLGFPGNP